MKRNNIIFFSILMIMFTPLYAADVNIQVTTPGRFVQNISDVPAAVEVIMPAQLESTQGETIDEKLTMLIPGLSTTRNAGDISNRTASLSLRGLGAGTQGGRSQGRTLIMLDGVPINNSATGGVNWNDLAIEEIDRVEVIKGPASVLYGSNAIGGVINIITKAAKKGVSLETSYGTYNTFDSILRAGAAAGSFSLQIFGKHLESDGYIRELPADRNAYTKKGWVRENSYGLKAAYDAKKLGTLKAQYQKYDGFVGMGTNYLNTAKGEYRESDTDMFRFSWSGSNDNTNWNISSFVQDTDQTRVENTGKNGIPGTRTDIDINRKDYGINSSVSKNILGLTAIVGFDWRHGGLDGYDDYNNGKFGIDKGETDTYAPFIQLDKKLLEDKLTLSAGVRYDTVKFHDGYSDNTNGAYTIPTTGKLKEYTWHSISPKFSVGYKYTDKVSQYVSYAKGFRAGELEDMTLVLIKGTWYQSPNPNLQPEKAKTVETGFKMNPADGLFVDPNIYFTSASDFIYRVKTGQTTLGKNEQMYTNIGKVQIYGFEIPIKYIIGNVNLSASYTQSHSRIISANGMNIKGNSLTYAPHHIYNAGISYKPSALRGKTELSLNWMHKSKMYTSDDNTEVSSGYSVTGAVISQKISKNISASVKFGNIFNERFQQADDELAPGRTVTGTVKVLF